ncbi:MAG: dihydroorotase [Candidatus Obscuribacterales bacterium]|nr:dihydroorotase [Candidatus Obscuribacterales bacterium]
MEQTRIRKIDDMHLHVRQGEMLRKVLPHTISQCDRALVMPNTTPAILSNTDVIEYKKSIIEALPQHSTFQPLMTFKITPAAKPEQIAGLKQAGVLAGKLYPDGVTTNSEGGVTDFQSLYPLYEAMQNEGLVLCLHGEMPGEFSLDRETKFLIVLKQIAQNFPKLKIVLEHATTADAVKCVMDLPENVAATVTVHHLYLTLDDIIGDKLNPHAFCKPVAKRPEDREALREVVLKSNPKFFLGSDSAPHAIADKECACGAAGVYSAPVLLPALFELFEKEDKLDNLEAFTSLFGAQFYGLPVNQNFVTLLKENWSVPQEYGGVKPFLSGTNLRWRVATEISPEPKIEAALHNQ